MVTNVRQTIVPGISVGSIKNIPDKWSAAWFRGFVSQYLQHSDTRNAIAGEGIVIAGTLGTPATISSNAISGPPFSVFGNATGATGSNAGIQATAAGQVLNFNGTSLLFSQLLLANASGLGPSLTVNGLQVGSVLQATMDGDTAGFSPVIFPTAVSIGDILIGAQEDEIGSLPIGTPGQYLTVSGSSAPEWTSLIPGSLTVQGTVNQIDVVTSGTTATVSLDADALNFLLPSQTGQAGAVLSTNGTNVSWQPVTPGGITSVLGTPNQIDVNTLSGAATVSFDVNALTSLLPAQSGQSGNFLGTNGTAASWSSPFPSQTGLAGDVLTTNGTVVSWEAAPAPVAKTGTFTGTLTGMASTTTGTFNYVISSDGAFCMIYCISIITGTSNDNTMTLTGLPTVCQPANPQFGTVQGGADAGDFPVTLLYALNAGVFTFTLLSPSGSYLLPGEFENFGAKGLGAGAAFSTYALL